MVRSLAMLFAVPLLPLLLATCTYAQPVEPFPEPGAGVQEQAPPGGAAEAEAFPEVGVAEAGEPGERAPLELDAQLEAEYALYADRMERTIATSGVNVQFNDSDHIRVIAAPNVAAPFLQDIKKLEGIIGQNFPEPMKSSVDLRAANIAIFMHRSDWERWVRALFDEFEADGFEFNGMDIEQRMVDSGSFHLNGIFNILLDGREAEGARRSVAFAVGYQYYNQLTLEQGPDALACGFGNLAEEALFGSPSVMVFSGYADRQRANQAGAWPAEVRQRFQQNLSPSLEALFGYTTAHMQFPHYAESWSATSMLVGDTEKFSQLLLAIRGGADPRQSVFEVYGFDEDMFHEAWRQSASR